MKKLSVITITYNNYKGLLKTLELLKTTAFSEAIEIVIVDGGSKDETPDFLKTQTCTSNWVSEPDLGIYDAMNKGLNMAMGRYVWFLNAGDYAIDLEAIESILANLEKEPDALFGETMLIDAQGNELGTRSEQTTRKLSETLTWKSFAMGMTVGHQAFIIRRSLALPYDIRLKHVADIDWMIRCLKKCQIILNLNRIIACFTLDGYSTINRRASNRERFRVLGKHYGFIPNLVNHLRITIRHILN
jgi:glycosyltransferase involved in cell wall biosynthesis